MDAPIDTATPHAWLLPLKVAALVTVIGPAAGGLVLAALMVIGEAAQNGAVQLKEMIYGVPWLLFMSYLFGTIPALVAGLALAAYVHWTGRPPWIAGLIIGALAPPLCFAMLGAAGLPQTTVDWEWFRDTAKFAAFTGGVGFAAALITSLLIKILLRRSIAEHVAAAQKG